MKRRVWTVLGIALAGIVALFVGSGCGPGRPPAETDAMNPAGRLPSISPDYTGIVIPPNIAPLNFRVVEPGYGYFVRLSSDGAAPIELSASDGHFRIPEAAWRGLLDKSKGHSLRIEVAVKNASGAWTRFDAIENTVAQELVDSHVAYRRMAPWYQTYGEIGIYQRNLETFAERAILKNSDFTGRAGGTCINCHAFSANRPDRMTIHARFPFVMFLARGKEVATIETRTEFNKGPFAYTAWHPGGRWAVYSVNKILQMFHTVGETRDIFDFTSDLLLYDIDTNTVTTTSDISRPDQLETFPGWSPDGRCLYFCRTPALPGDAVARYREVKYDLMRISFDPETASWGTLETVLASAELGKSVGLPRPSPDGRHVLLCLFDYGTFPIFQESSDLYMLDLETRALEPLACNSNKSEAWHSWSTNGRWIVFSSKRSDGLLARLYLSYIDTEGRASKAFVLPQEDPAYYDAFAETYSAPEFIQGPVEVSREALAAALRNGTPTQAILDPAALKSRQKAPEAPAAEYGNQS